MVVFFFCLQQKRALKYCSSDVHASLIMYIYICRRSGYSGIEANRTATSHNVKKKKKKRKTINGSFEQKKKRSSL